MSSSKEPSRASSAQKVLDTLFDISQLLNTELDKQTLAVCVNMIEAGVNPEALATVVLELRREAAASTKAKKDSRTETKT